MRQKTLTITDSQGLHVRAATALVSLSRKFRSRITLERNGSKADAQSVLELLMLSAGRGTRVLVTAAGDDEGEALAAVENLVHQGFRRV